MKRTLCSPEYLRAFPKGKARSNELQRLWDEMLAELLKDVEEKRPETFEYTVADLIDLFLETKLSGKKDVADPTRRLKYWKSQIGKLPVNYTDKQNRSLWPGEILKVKKKIKSMKATRGTRIGLPILDRTVNGYFEDLRRLFSFAIELGQIETNPVRRGLVFETVDKSRNERKRELGEHEGEKEALIEACRTSESPDLWDAFRFASWIGCRAGEMYKLKWTDVNLKDGIIKFKDRKNERDQEVSLETNPDCLQMLRERKLKSTGERKKEKARRSSWKRRIWSFRRASSRLGIRLAKKPGSARTPEKSLALLGMISGIRSRPCFGERESRSKISPIRRVMQGLNRLSDMLM